MLGMLLMMLLTALRYLSCKMTVLTAMFLTAGNTPDVINNTHIRISIFYSLNPNFYLLSCNLHYVSHVYDARKKTADIYHWLGTLERSNQMSECK